jgi:DNA-binding response OmpR family regulator
MPLSLTLVEFQLLSALLDPPGCVKKRRELVETVLDRKYDSYDRSLDVHICKLRRKIGLNENGVERIKTFHGAGYCFVCPPHHRQASNLS